MKKCDQKGCCLEDARGKLAVVVFFCESLTASMCWSLGAVCEKESWKLWYEFIWFDSQSWLFDEFSSSYAPALLSINTRAYSVIGRILLFFLTSLLIQWQNNQSLILKTVSGIIVIVIPRGHTSTENKQRIGRHQPWTSRSVNSLPNLAFWRFGYWVCTKVLLLV